jgi:hypothetical protein
VTGGVTWDVLIRGGGDELHRGRQREGARQQGGGVRRNAEEDNTVAHSRPTLLNGYLRSGRASALMAIKSGAPKLARRNAASRNCSCVAYAVRLYANLRAGEQQRKEVPVVGRRELSIDTAKIGDIPADCRDAGVY